MVIKQVYSKNTVYYFIENKVNSISLNDFNGNTFTDEDIEKLINAVKDGDKIEIFDIENCDDIKISSSFDIDKSDEIK